MVSPWRRIPRLAAALLCVSVAFTSGCATIEAFRAASLPSEIADGAKLLHQGKDAAAVAEFDKAIAHDPSAALVYAVIAQDMCNQLNRPALGLKYAEQGLQATPKASKKDRARLDVAAANACAGLGNYPKAVDYCRAALELVPDSPDYKNALAYTLAEWAPNRKDLEEALTLSTSAVASARNYPEIKDEGLGVYVDTLGWVYYKMAEYDKATTYLAHAADLAPMFPDIHYHLARAYKALGRDDQAQTALDRAEKSMLGQDAPKPQLKALIGDLRAQLPAKHPAATHAGPALAPR